MPVLRDLAAIASDLRRSELLANPRRLCERLGLLDGAKRQSGDGVLIRCPSHQERTPSCSVTRGPDGTVRCRCFACDWTGDALTLIGVVTGRTGFAELVDEVCDMVGVPRPSETEAREWVAPERDSTLTSYRGNQGTRGYPEDAARFWSECGPVSESDPTVRMLVSRGISASSVQRRDLARAIRESGNLPRWASRRVTDEDTGDSWVEDWRVSGHVLVLPVYDSLGEFRSVRAWRVVDGSGPKRLPPGGHTATGLVLANAAALSVLRQETGPCRIVIVEGEPDFLTWASKTDDAVFGVLSGAWTDEHAKRIRLGSTILVRTHVDKAGEKYAQQIAGTLKGRGQIRRLVAA